MLVSETEDKLRGLCSSTFNYIHSHLPFFLLEDSSEFQLIFPLKQSSIWMLWMQVDSSALSWIVSSNSFWHFSVPRDRWERTVLHSLHSKFVMHFLSFFSLWRDSNPIEWVWSFDAEACLLSDMWKMVVLFHKEFIRKLSITIMKS